jgi:cytochrome P450
MYRRPVAHAYSLSSLKGYEPYIDDMIQTLVNVLDQHVENGSPINMSDWLHYCKYSILIQQTQHIDNSGSFDVISKLTFGEPIGFMSHGGDFNGMIKSQKAIFRYIGIVNNMPTLDALLKRNPFLKLLKTKPSMFFTFAKRIVEERVSKAKSDPEAGSLKPSKAYPDLLANFIAAKNNYPEIVTDLRVTHYCTTNVVAGANNSALSLDRTMQYLAENPPAQERLYQEILTVDSDKSFAEKETEGPAALELALKMPYLEAVVLESYRTFGSPSNNLERVVSPAGMTLPSGEHLPPGTVVAMNGPSLNRRTDVYGPDADNYNPLRWMKGEDESEESFKERRLKMDRASLTFGHGSRSCIGKNIVQLEIYKIWATLMRIYTVRSPFLPALPSPTPPFFCGKPRKE